MKIFLSAIETNAEHGRAVEAARAPSLLTSYYYARTLAGVRQQIWIRALAQAKVRLIDSGAYSIRTAAADKGIDLDYDKFFSEYLVWLRGVRAKRLADLWVEIDIGLAIGSAWVVKHRKAWLKSGLGSGLIQVWHPLEHTWKDWEALVAESQEPGRSNYVAIEGHSYAREPIDYDRFLAYAFKRGCRVHGFRLTSIKDCLLRYPFYSVDSTTWMTGVSFGTSVGTGKDGWLSLSKKNTDPAWGFGTAPRYAKGRVRLDWLTESAKRWVELESQITRYWEQRGIRWAA